MAGHNESEYVDPPPLGRTPLGDHAKLVHLRGHMAILLDFICGITDLHASEPSLFISTEGNNVSRDGSIFLVQLYVKPLNTYYIIDVLTMGAAAFNTAGRNSGRTLQNILEDATIVKAFFDVRNDADALWKHFRIRMQGVQDIQLMEFAARRVIGLPKIYVDTLREAIHDKSSAVEFHACRRAGEALFHQKGKTDVLTQRPLPSEACHYLLQGVKPLPDMWYRFNTGLSQDWRQRVMDESDVRIVSAQSPTYLPFGEHKKFAPEAWQQRRTES